MISKILGYTIFALLMQSLLPQPTTNIDVSDSASTVSIPLVEILEGGCHVEAEIIKEMASVPANTRVLDVHIYAHRF